MKNYYDLVLILFAILLPSLSIAQNAHKTLKTSSLSHTFSNEGFVKKSFNNEDHYNRSHNSAGFNLGFASGLLITGNDPNGELQTSVNLFRPYDHYLPGILSSQTGDPIEDNELYFNRIWTISTEDIQSLKDLFSEGMLTVADIPSDVLEWPAKGNPHFAYLIEENLAPFYDFDGDDIYNPLNGDLPLALAEKEDFFPSKFTFCVYYNYVNKHMVTDHHTMEISQINYTLDCPENELQNAVFSRFQIKNKHTDELRNTKLGLYNDFDLGCHFDDNVGSHEGTNSIYTYNKFGQDQFPCSDTKPIPAGSSAIYSSIFLSHPLSSCMPIYDFNESVPEPILTTHFHNLLNGKFSDGTPLTRGGDGYNTASTEETNLVFSDLPNDANGWHLNSTPGLICRSLVASVDLGTLEPNQTKTVDFVDVLFPFDKTDFSIFDEYEDRVNNLIDLYNQAASPSSTMDCHTYTYCEKECVWPGDLNENGRVEADDLALLAAMNEDFVPGAKKRQRISSEWQPFHSQSWQEESSGIDYKHGDINGNGQINRWDLELLSDNFKLENEYYEKQPDVIPVHDSQGISVDIYNTEEINPVTGLLAKLARARIILGDENLNIPNSIVSLSFDLKIDTDLVYFSPWFDKEGNAFDVIERYYEEEDPINPTIPDVFNYSERQSFAMYQSDFPIVSGGILMDDISIGAHTLGGTNNPDGEEYTKIELVNIMAYDKNGNQLDIGTRFVDSVLVTDITYDPSLSTTNESPIKASIYPNPVNNRLNINLTNAENGLIKVVDLHGKLIDQLKYESRSFEINTSAWPNGIYILCISDKNGSISKKVIKF